MEMHFCNQGLASAPTAVAQICGQSRTGCGYEEDNWACERSLLGDVTQRTARKTGLEQTDRCHVLHEESAVPLPCAA